MNASHLNAVKLVFGTVGQTFCWVVYLHYLSTGIGAVQCKAVCPTELIESTQLQTNIMLLLWLACLAHQSICAVNTNPLPQLQLKPSDTSVSAEPIGISFSRLVIN